MELKPIRNKKEHQAALEEIRTLLGLWSDRARSSADVKALAQSRAAELGRKVRALEAMRRSLNVLAQSCHGDDRPDCPILEHLAE